MALTLEDLDRRVTALEKGAEREKTIVRAVAEIVSESEQRVRAEMSDLRAEMSGLRAEMRAETRRLTVRVSRSERRMVDILNDRFDQVMAALDPAQQAVAFLAMAREPRRPRPPRYLAEAGAVCQGRERRCPA